MADSKRAGPHPGFSDPIKLKIWEIRHQVDINIDIVKREYPAEKNSVFPHIIETLSDHVFDRLDELEGMTAKLNTAKGE